MIAVDHVVKMHCSVFESFLKINWINLLKQLLFFDVIVDFELLMMSGKPVGLVIAEHRTAIV